MDLRLHAHTPTISPLDGRGLMVRVIALHRQDSAEPAHIRVTRHSYNPAGRLIASQDPRLPHPNQTTLYSLSGQALLTESVDAGWRLALPGEAGQMVEGWDSRGNRRRVEYDALLRPVAVTEQDLVVERFIYGGPGAAEDNQCNQLIRHDDPAGTRYLPDYGLLGSPLTEVRHFLLEPDTPDWPEAVVERDALLEANGLEMGWAFNALGEVIEQTDALGNRQRFIQTVAGQAKAVDLQLADATQPHVLVDDIHYNAFDQVEQETAGNGVISRSQYDPRDGRLTELTATLPGRPPLQHLKYHYDPVGNILSVEDAAQPVHFYANQRIEPINHYRYDTLYQLIEASGREVNTGTSHGPALPGLQNLPPDPNRISNYTQHYDYDAGGNLLEMRHVGAQPFTRTLLVDPDSNRSLPDDEVDVGLQNGFDANGNLQQLVRGQDLRWDGRNQLHQISTVQRENGPNDGEIYIYDGNGQRCRKITRAQASGRILTDEVRYLPGLEIRTHSDGEIFHVISTQAGRNSVRVLHWQAGKPTAIVNDQVRYSLSDHLGSSTLELDQQGGLISQESYYPFGGTAWWAARSVVEAKYKTVRYSGKERDASGLYYYGFRYYSPWLQRWINPDPAGDVNGLNLFCFTANAPIHKIEKNGQFYEGLLDEIERIFIANGAVISARGLGEFSQQDKNKIQSILQETTYSLEGALEMIKSYPSESTDIMRSYFGYEHQSATTKIVESWEKIHNLSIEYQSQIGQGKFVAFNNYGLSAIVMKTDRYGRIFINLDVFNYPTQPKTTIAHELSHLGRVNRMVTVGPRTQDFYYLQPEEIHPLTGGFRELQHTNPYQSISELITGGGLTTAHNFSPRSLPAFIGRVNSLHNGPDNITDIKTAISVFNRNPRIITTMASENADSLVHAAYELNENYRRMTSRNPRRSAR